MAAKVKFRKCPDCGDKMTVRKSTKNKSKFWGCSRWPDCDCIVPYYGDGAKAGTSVDIREIQNGYVVTTCDKYPTSNTEDEDVEFYCENEASLRMTLGSIFDDSIIKLIEKVQASDQFDEEPQPAEKKKRSNRASKGETNVEKLISKLAKAKKRAEDENIVDS